MSKQPTLNILDLEAVPIEEQLLLEEKLLRLKEENYCIINAGAPPAIVLGISGKPEEHLTEKAIQNQIPVIKRYSGGGSVVVDANTLFISFILDKQITGQNFTPELLMAWNAELLKKAYPHVPLELKEHDVVIGKRKCVGNAQYFQKNRVCHHSTLLYDYSLEKMNYLSFPPKTPTYREKRSHEDFLCSFKPFFSHVSSMKHLLKTFLMHNYSVKFLKVSDLDLKGACRLSTKRLELANSA